MCGIFGALSLDGHRLNARERLERMAQVLHHRGPDATRYELRPTFALGVNRLAIIDCAHRADQPFADRGGSALLGCNGEIYNAAELRTRFSRYPFRSRSDVETLLPLLEARGPAALAEVEGMFALAWWDTRRRTLLLARDRAGEKPLFYTQVDGELWFASEIAALLTHPHVRRHVDPIALSQYLRFGYVLEPRTLFKSIRRVEAGTALEIDQRGRRFTVRYWDPVGQSYAPPRGDAAEQVLTLLGNAVGTQIRADVPVGAFLSGGIDSSLVALFAARALGNKPLTTFCARFDAASYDESAAANAFAKRIGAKHIDVPCDDAGLCAALQTIGASSAEPISDPAVLPTFLLAREASRHVRVVLSGEGADELFGGYPTYLGHKLAPLYRGLPQPLKLAIAQLIAHVPVSGRKVSLEFLLRRFVAGADRGWFERHLLWFGVEQPAARDERLASIWIAPLLARFGHRSSLQGAMLLDYCTALREKLLVKSDRATMLSSLELRAPFLDRCLTELAFGVPERDKVRGLTTKWLLKRAAARVLPRSVVTRRKRGLSVPIAAMINGSLREQVDHWLAPNHLRTYGLLDVPKVRTLLAEHRAGRADHARSLWPVIALQIWAERWNPVAPDRLSVPDALDMSTR